MGVTAEAIRCDGCGRGVSIESSSASMRLQSLGEDVYVALLALFGIQEPRLQLCAACFLAAYGQAVQLALGRRADV